MSSSSIKGESPEPKFSVTSEERLNLDKLMREMDSVDNTEYIRKAKQSGKIAHDINIMEKLKRDSMHWRFDEPEKFAELCQGSCKYLFNNYTNIFNKLVKDEINMDIMKQFLLHLSLIENGELDQHEGSVLIGRLLRDLFLTSAANRANKLDEEHDTGKPVLEEGKPISWTEFKTRKAAILRNLDSADMSIDL